MTRTSQVALVGENPPASAGAQVASLGLEAPPEEGMATTPAFLPRKFHGQRSLVGHSPEGHTESDTTEVT